LPEHSTELDLMNQMNRGFRITSLILVGVGIAFLALNIATGGAFNITLPLVFLMLGGAFFILAFAGSQKWDWTGYLFIPGAILIAFGIIFLINILTGDWTSWAYAWLFLVAGAGAGLAFSSVYMRLDQRFTWAGLAGTLVGVTLFALFGAIAGGKLIQVMAPILLAMGGLALYWLKPEILFSPEGFKQRFQNGVAISKSAVFPSEQNGLVEPLSSRELEVLALIDAGLSNPEIAEKLTLAPSTVKTHINNIYGKLGVQTRIQALNRARELKLLD